MASFQSYYQPSEFDKLMAQPTIDFKNFDKSAKGDLNKNNLMLLDDLQANILQHHKKNFACHIIIRFKKGQEQNARDWIGNLKITTANQELEAGSKIPMISCFYLSYPGYIYLGVPHWSPKNCPSFKKGLRPEIADSFDQKISSPFPKVGIDAWPIHAVLLMASDDESELVDEVTKKQENLAPLAVVDLEYGVIKRHQGNKGDKKTGRFVEWFGYTDDVSGTRFFPDRRSAGANERFSKVPTMETILTQDPGGASVKSAGSYLVFLKLKQDVDAYEELRKEIAARILPRARSKRNYRQELAEAFILGRFKDGTPVSKIDKDDQMEKSEMDDFDYNDYQKSRTNGGYLNDRKGTRCPLHAHVRKANPRFSDISYEERTLHRRGMLYVNGVKEKSELKHVVEKGRTTILKTGKEVGMLFLAFQSQIEKQFEYIIKKWMHNNFAADGMKSGKDILTSKSDKSELYVPESWNSEKQKSFQKMESLVQLRGGCYLFAPSISCLKKLISWTPLNTTGNIKALKAVPHDSLSPPKPLLDIDQSTGGFITGSNKFEKIRKPKSRNNLNL